jgi:hypothetical protein
MVDQNQFFLIIIIIKLILLKIRENCKIPNIRIGSASLALVRSKRVTTSGVLTKRATGSGAFGENASASGVFSPYKLSAPSLRISQTHRISTLTNTNRSNIQLFHFFKMIPNLNYYPADEENYIAEQPNGSSFLAGIFPTHDQTDSYQIYDQTNSY